MDAVAHAGAKQLLISQGLNFRDVRPLPTVATSFGIIDHPRDRCAPRNVRSGGSCRHEQERVQPSSHPLFGVTGTRRA